MNTTWSSLSPLRCVPPSWDRGDLCRLLAALCPFWLCCCGYEFPLEGPDTSATDSGTASETQATDSETSSETQATDSDTGSTTQATDSDTGSTTQATDSDTGSDNPEITLFYESFENPNVTGCDGTTQPNGWVVIGHPSYVGLDNEDCGLFATPFGAQALRIYTPPSPAIPTTFTTTSAIFKENLAPNTTYTLTGNVARLSNQGPTNYRMQLLAIDDVNAVETVLEFSAGSVDTSDMSRAVSVQFTTGDSHANLGERIAIRLQKDPSADWQTNPRFDNVRLTATQ